MEFNISEEMLEVRQFILNIFNGIPDPKRMLANVIVVDDETDEKYKVDYIFFTSHGPFAIFLKPTSLRQISYLEFVLKDFLFSHDGPNYFPAFGYFPESKNNVIAFSNPVELTNNIVSRIFGRLPEIHEQESYEYYSIIEQYTEENFEETMKARMQLNNTDVDPLETEKTESEKIADMFGSSNN